jgi:hypothetical protein
VLQGQSLASELQYIHSAKDLCVKESISQIPLYCRDAGTDTTITGALSIASALQEIFVDYNV